MKIGIVTIYESATNYGSFLQAYALQTVLERLGHEVYLIQNVPTWQTAKKCVMRINPKREFFLRMLKTIEFIKDMSAFRLVKKEKLGSMDFDCLIYGSDEIWNLENPYFRDGLFWGEYADDIPKIAYAISVGALEEKTLDKYKHLTLRLSSFDNIFVRDDRTHDIVSELVQKSPEYVCDPTLLLPLSHMEKDINLPKDKYLFVYTYGVDKNIEDKITAFAKKMNLKIVSACFWHKWADKVIECSPLKLSKLIAGAEYVFTSTFHGAIFTLLNHKRCCILPVRDKVRDIVCRLGEEVHLISGDCDMSEFETVIEQAFDTEDFEARLEYIRHDSMEKLEGALKCLTK